MKIKIKIISLIILTTLLTIGCSSDGNNNANNGNEKLVAVRKQTSQKKTHAKTTLDYYSLPSPMEIANAIQQTGVQYEPEILHQAEYGNRYTTTRAMAINLGIYGADLSYSIYFGQQQDAMKYMGCIKNLASNLDISNILTDDKLKSIEDNIQNKEVLKKIISQTFFHSDAFLKENRRSETAAMIMFGMWLESMYISAKLTDGDVTKNPELSQCIMEQQYVFETLIGLLATFEKNNDINTISTEINQLGVDFDAIKQNADAKNEDKKISNAENFNKLCTSVEKLRTDYTMLF